MKEKHTPCFLLENVEKTYRNGNEETRALQAVSVEIPWGAKVAVLGYSGHGKSTLLNLLGCLDRGDADSGRFVYFRSAAQTYCLIGQGDGEAVIPTPDQTCRLRRCDFGFIFQFHHLLDSLTVAEQAVLGRRLQGVPKAGAVKDVLTPLKALGLDGRARFKPRQLSGGQAQRLAALRAVLHEPRIVFADEPTGNLDAENACRVLDLLDQWHEAGSDESPRTLILATHDIAEAYRRCDAFLVLRHGKLVSPGLLRKDRVGSPEDLGRWLVAETAPSSEASEPSGAPSGDEARLALPSGAAATPASPSAAFLLELGQRDLCDRPGTVLASMVTLLLLVILSALGWGLLEGKRWLLGKELQSPLARCLEVGSYDVVDRQLLDRLLAVRLADGRPLTDDPEHQVYPWISMTKTFWEGDEQGPTRMVNQRLRGRSVQRGDPLLAGSASSVRAGDPAFSGDDAREIIVTDRFLKLCGYVPDAKTVWMEHGRHGQHKLPMRVVAVVESIPGRTFEFLLPDGLCQAMDQPDFNPVTLHDRVILQVQARQWNSDRAREAMADLIQNLGLNTSYETGRLELRLPPGQMLDAEQVRSLALAAAGRLRQAGLITASPVGVDLPEVQPELVIDEQRDALAEQPSRKEGEKHWTNVTIVTRKVTELPDVARAVAPLGLEANEHYLLVLERLRRTIGPLQTLLALVVLAAMATAVLNLAVVSFERVQRKTYEVGILKACGMTARQPAAVFVWQGFLIGAAAGLLGVGTAWGLGAALSDALAGVPFLLGWPRAVAIFGVVTLLSALACWAGTLRATRLPPAVALRR